MNRQEAAEILKIAYDCRKLGYWPHNCDKCPNTEKCYTSRQHREAIEIAIDALGHNPKPEALTLEQIKQMHKPTPFEEKCADVITYAAKKFMRDAGFDLSQDYDIESHIRIEAAISAETIFFTVDIAEPEPPTDTKPEMEGN